MFNHLKPTYSYLNLLSIYGNKNMCDLKSVLESNNTTWGNHKYIMKQL